LLGGSPVSTGAIEERDIVALFGRKSAAEEEPEQPPPLVQEVGGTAQTPKKGRPTPSRKEAEEARRRRVTRTLSKKEARQEASRQSRLERAKAMSAREGTPEKILMRDYIDARFSIGEFLLPALVVILALTFLSTTVPRIAFFSTLLMYAFILLVLIDCFIMWRGFKKVLAERLPRATAKGLLMYGMNRSIQIRRFRMPPPRIKRGEEY
jgi:hypothetical protein